ncbi:glycosyltransferase [Streptococcus uberis]|uniref:glycosyltransferase n=1 Tax=Streptococcus uberis TaxID=1349 RepID=UPI0027DD2AE3|nr:glycosyltransferase [Streptococcus uberis]MCK1237246.1 glycosyltransferase [Streptococcus uberis]
MYKGKRFLLTHIWLRGFSGAEINILELATYLKEKGATVEVFTFLATSPMIEEFQKRDILVIDDIDHPFEITQYDVVFSAQNIIPPAIINALGKKQVKFPKFLFFHMAALQEHVLEQPYIYGLEEKISSGTLAISEEIVEKNLNRFFKRIPNLQYYPNPVPDSYATKNHIPKKTPETILVISNHPPQEILDMKPILAERGIQIDYFGVWSDHYELVSPELIDKYDCVIGIGKNAQYCLVMGKPIYIYDHFKGPGYLSDAIFEKTAYHNFSGRGFENSEKTAEELVSDLLEGYREAQEFQQHQLEHYRSQYIISYIVQQICKSIQVKSCEITLLPKEDIEYFKAMTLLTKTRIVRLENDVNNLWDAIHHYEHLNKEKNYNINSLEKELSTTRFELNLIKESTLFKLHQFLRQIKDFFTKTT